MSALRTVVVFATWPFVYLADRLRGVDPPASLRVGLGWARGELRYGRPIVGRGAAVTAPRRVAPARVLEPGEQAEWGSYPMPDLPPIERLILSELVRYDDERAEYVYDFWGNHGCEWPDGGPPPRETWFENCNCGAAVEFAKRLAAGIQAIEGGEQR